MPRKYRIHSGGDSLNQLRTGQRNLVLEKKLEAPKNTPQQPGQIVQRVYGRSFQNGFGYAYKNKNGGITDKYGEYLYTPKM